MPCAMPCAMPSAQHCCYLPKLTSGLLDQTHLPVAFRGSLLSKCYSKCSTSECLPCATPCAMPRPAPRPSNTATEPNTPHCTQQPTILQLFYCITAFLHSLVFLPYHKTIISNYHTTIPLGELGRPSLHSTACMPSGNILTHNPSFSPLMALAFKIFLQSFYVN